MVNQIRCTQKSDQARLPLSRWGNPHTNIFYILEFLQGHCQYEASILQLEPKPIPLGRLQVGNSITTQWHTLHINLLLVPP